MQTFEAETIDKITDGAVENDCDAACKRVLALKKISSRILKAVVAEYKDTDIDEIMQLIGDGEISQTSVDADVPLIRMDNTEDSTLTEGTRFYDIKFTAAVPNSDEKINLIINIEAQKDYSPGYPLLKRGMYYCGRLLSSQYGTVFTGSDCGKLQKVYSIWICTNPDKAHRNTITRYEMTPCLIQGETSLTEAQKANEKSDYDLMSLVLVCLGGLNGDHSTENDIIRLLSVIFSSEITSTDKKNILEKDYNIAMTESENKEVEAMCNLSSGYIEYGEARGIKKGRAEGRADERAKIVKTMYEKSLSPKEIASLTNIYVEEVRRIIGEIDDKQ